MDRLERIDREVARLAELYPMLKSTLRMKLAAEIVDAVDAERLRCALVARQLAGYSMDENGKDVAEIISLTIAGLC